MDGQKILTNHPMRQIVSQFSDESGCPLTEMRKEVPMDPILRLDLMFYDPVTFHQSRPSFLNKIRREMKKRTTNSNAKTKAQAPPPDT